MADRTVTIKSLKLPASRYLRYTGSMQFEIDEQTIWLPYDGSQEADNLYIDIVGTEPIIKFVHYVKINNHHVDEVVSVGEMNLGTMANLEQFGKLIQEKITEFQQREV